MPDDLLNDWLTKTEAAAFLQVSEKTIERLATKGGVRRATRKRPGVRPLPVYNPDDLQKVKDSHTAQVVVVPSAEARTPTALAPRTDLPSFLKTFFPAADMPVQDKLFLTLKEAARYSGLPQSTIRRLVHVGQLSAVKAGGWRIKRSDLEKLDCRHLVDLSDNTVLNTDNKPINP